MENILEKIIQTKRQEESDKLNAILAVESLFEDLLERERDILRRRFGLHGEDEETLEKIGRLHSLTRERVRQIEAASLRKIKKLSKLEEYVGTIREAVAKLLSQHGGLMERKYMLDVLTSFCIDLGLESDAEREVYRRHFDFVISKLLDEDIDQVKNSDNFHSYFKLKGHDLSHLEELATELEEKINNLGDTMKADELLALVSKLESYSKHQEKMISGDLDMKDIFSSELYPEKSDLINNNKAVYSLLHGSKNVDRNKFGFWGLAHWPEIKPKKISDKIYLILKTADEPLHFTEIAKRINETGFDHKKANPGSIHNELILDGRYELVGRGVYALKTSK